jgi:hypothetical protein
MSDNQLAGVSVLPPDAIKRRTFECHVTIDPVFGEDRDKLARYVEHYQFKLAELVMVKDAASPMSPSQRDSFMTGHANSYDALFVRGMNLLIGLRGLGFNVRRFKIEEILFDTKYGDPMP